MRVIWTPIITPGQTITAFQISFAATFRIADQQLWCEPHKKTCARFAFGVCNFFNENPQFIDQPDFMA